MAMGDWMLPGGALILVVLAGIVLVALDDIVMSVWRSWRDAAVNSRDQQPLQKVATRSWRSSLRRGTKAVIRRSSRMSLPRRQSGRL